MYDMKANFTKITKPHFLVVKEGAMRRYHILCLSIIMFICMLTSAYAERLALVIGNADYKKSPLKTPVNDAEKMASTLRRFGFEVIEETNLKRKAMKQAISDFGDRLEEYGRVGLFYFSGHGLEFKGLNYLVPIRVNIKSAADIEFEALDVSYVLKQMERNQGLNIVILDACRDNPYKSFMMGESTKGMAGVGGFKGYLIAYSTGPGKVAYANNRWENSIYTKHLLDVLQDMPRASITDILMEVRKKVVEETGGEQVPWESVAIMEKFHFELSQPPTTTPVGPSFRIRSVIIRDTMDKPIQPVDNIYSIKFGQTITITVNIVSQDNRNIRIAWSTGDGIVPPILDSTTNTYTPTQQGGDFIVIHVWDKSSGERVEYSLNINVVP